MEDKVPISRVRRTFDRVLVIAFVSVSAAMVKAPIDEEVDLHLSRVPRIEMNLLKLYVMYFDTTVP